MSVKQRIKKLESQLKAQQPREPGAILFLSDNQTVDEAMLEYMELHGLSERPKGKVIIFQGYKGEW